MGTRKIGIWTVSLCLIAVGVALILQISGVLAWDVWEYLFPLIVIAFGIEVILYRSRRPEVQLQFSAWGIVVLVLSLVISVIGFVVPHVVRWTSSVFSPRYLCAVNGQMNVKSGIRQVDIEIPNGNVTVTGTSGNGLSYSGELSIPASSQAAANTLLHSEWTVQQSGTTLTMILHQPQPNISLGPWQNNSSPYLNVQLPTALITNVTTTNGNVQISQMNANDEISTTNGDLTLQNVDGSVNATSTNGDVTFTNIGGPVTADTTNGSITGQSNVDGNWQCSTTNGDVTLTLPSGVNANVTGDTSNGDVEGNVNWNFSDSSQDHGTATIGRGTDTLNLSSTNGDIVVNTGN